MAKRTYVKPELLYENFVLAQHIAACYYHTNSNRVAVLMILVVEEIRVRCLSMDSLSV